MLFKYFNCFERVIKTMDGEESTELGGNFDLQIDIVSLLNSWFYRTSLVD